MTTTPAASQPTGRRGIPAAALAMVGWAASGVIGKGIGDLGPLGVVFWRMWIYTAIVLVVLRMRGTPLRRESIRISLPGGIALSADIMLFFVAVRLTTVANATVIGSCQPLLMLVLGGRLFGERARKTDWGLAAIALSGVAIVMYGSSDVPGWNPAGDLLSLLTLCAWTLYFIFSKFTRARVDAAQYTGATALISAAVATPFALATGQAFAMPSPSTWFWLLVLSVGPGFTSHMLMNWALGQIPAWLASTLTLAIPVTGTLMAWAFLGEAVVALQFVGMAVVLGALGAIVLGQSTSQPRSDGATPT